MTWITWKGEAHESLSVPWCLWIGLSTGLGYTVQRAVKHRMTPDGMPPLRMAFWARHGRLMVALWGAFWLVFTATQWTALGLLEHSFWLISLVVLGLLYAFVPGKSHGLRAYPWLKIPLVATAWTLATVPVFSENTIWLAVLRWLFIAGLTLPFDIRDMEVDRSCIRTIPMMWGIRQAFNMSIVSLLLSALLIGQHAGWQVTEVHHCMFVAQATLAAGLLTYSELRKDLTQGSELSSEHWTGWVLDGVMWLPLLCMFVP